MVKEEEISARERKPKRSELDWEQLRTKSLQHGGFGDERADLWPKLLNVSVPKDTGKAEAVKSPLEEEQAHQDERQIGLDTDRSFVLYPVEQKCSKETLQADLHKLLVSVFRKRPRLHYFQGYHDIVTVLFLTLPPETRLLCAEKLSLHRLRDSMGLGLEPVLGLLRVTKNLLQLADLEYAQILERNSPLPFYALSNLLTLFSHDIPTLPLIQHVFDYLFCRPPIAVVYLAASIILSRKKKVIQYEEEDEDGMIHSLLSSLPNLADDVQDQDLIQKDPGALSDESLEGAGDNTFFKEEGKDQLLPDPLNPAVELTVEVESDNTLDRVAADEITPIHTITPSLTKVRGNSVGDIGPPTIPLEYQEQKWSDDSASKWDENPPKEGEVDRDIRSLSGISTPEASTSPNVSEEVKEERYTTPPHNSVVHPRPERLFLTDLLKHADALRKEFPPSHPGLALSSIMGPQSVVFTWSESFSELPSDNTAEAMVSHPQLVVYPYVEIDPHQKELSDKEEKEATSSKARRKRRKIRKSPFGQVEKKTMLAGTVLVLGVAMAVYGIKARNSHGGYITFYGVSEGRGPKDWRRVGGWVGGALTGMGEKIMKGLLSAS